MAKSEKKLSWMNIDPEDLKGNKLYDEMRAAQAAEKIKRSAFEADFIEKSRKKKKIADDETLRFSYRFGPAVAKDARDDEKKGGTF